MHINGQRIYQARLGAKMSQTDLAFAIRRRSDAKPDAAAVSGWERGDHEPRATVVAAIARATGRDIEFFYGGDELAGDDDEEEALPPDLIEALRPLAHLLAKAGAR